jgi:hypothetical protein
MWWRSRKLSVVTAASYLLVVTFSALFHDHHAEGHQPSRPGIVAVEAGDDHDCPVCQFLAQKPAPATIVAPEMLSTLVQDAAAAAPCCSSPGVFTAWQSRAPPALA